MKLFNENENYTEKGRDLDRRMAAFVHALIKDHPEVSLRELDYLLCNAVSLVCTEQLLLRQTQKTKQKRLDAEKKRAKLT